MSSRTINLDVTGRRVVLKRAISDGLIQRLATTNRWESLNRLVRDVPGWHDDVQQVFHAGFDGHERSAGELVLLWLLCHAVQGGGNECAEQPQPL